jgi:two-component SAPR family response regulator
MYKGTFLQKSESPWVASLANNLEQQFMTAAHAHALTLEVKDAIRVLEKILSINETDEAAWQGLIRNYLQDSQEQQAQWTFKRWQKVAFDFGFDPPSFQFPNPVQN